MYLYGCEACAKQAANSAFLSFASQHLINSNINYIQSNCGKRMAVDAVRCCSLYAITISVSGVVRCCFCCCHRCPRLLLMCLRRAPFSTAIICLECSVFGKACALVCFALCTMAVFWWLTWYPLYLCNPAKTTTSRSICRK